MKALYCLCVCVLCIKRDTSADVFPDEVMSACACHHIELF